MDNNYCLVIVVMHTTEVHHIQHKHQVSYTIMVIIHTVYAVDAIRIVIANI